MTAVESLPIALGLGAAVCWGTADFLAKKRTEAEGGLVTLLWLYLVGTPLFALIWVVRGFPLVEPATFAWWVLTGTMNALGYFALYRGFQVGLLSVVSTTNAAWAAITVLLAIVFLGESPTALAASGVVLTVAGVMLVSYSGGGWRITAPGFIQGATSALLFGTSFFLLKRPQAQGDVFAQAVTMRMVGLIVIGLALAARRTDFRRYLTRPPLFAFIDSAGFLSMVAGLSVGAAYLVSPLGSMLTPVAVLLAVMFLGERLNRWQWAGFVFVVSGALLLARYG